MKFNYYCGWYFYKSLENHCFFIYQLYAFHVFVPKTVLLKKAVLIYASSPSRSKRHAWVASCIDIGFPRQLCVVSITPLYRFSIRHYRVLFWYLLWSSSFCVSYKFTLFTPRRRKKVPVLRVRWLDIFVWESSITDFIWAVQWHLVMATCRDQLQLPLHFPSASLCFFFFFVWRERGSCRNLCTFRSLFMALIMSNFSEWANAAAST